MRVRAAVFAALVAASTGAGALVAGAPGAAFGLFAALTVGGALVCLWARSALRSAWALFATLLGTAGLYLLLGSDFLAVAQVLVGAGGVSALFLFCALLAPDDPKERSFSRIAVALLCLGALGAFIAWRSAGMAAFAGTQAGTQTAKEAEQIGVALLDPTRYAVAFEVAALILAVALVAAAAILRRSFAAQEVE